MGYRCPHCGTNSVPFFKAVFLTTRTTGVECTHCHERVTRPTWTFALLALIVPLLWVWERFTDPPQHVVYYAAEVAILWGLAILLIAPLKKLPSVPTKDVATEQ